MTHLLQISVCDVGLKKVWNLLDKIRSHTLFEMFKFELIKYLISSQVHTNQVLNHKTSA